MQANPGGFIFGDLDGVSVIEGVARVEFARGLDPVAVFRKRQRL